MAPTRSESVSSILYEQYKEQQQLLDDKDWKPDEWRDLEATVENDVRPPSLAILDTPSNPQPSLIAMPSSLGRFLGYPTPGSLKLRSTSWLDGVRGVAALGVYLFHSMGCWARLVPAWHADEAQTNILQLPLLRTLFVAGGPAVSLFFVVSGYVLTHKSIRWMRTGASHKVYPAVTSSMFRRGFRLYLPPFLLTFCEMLATRWGIAPALNFNFVPEATLWAQFLDWIDYTNRLANPFWNWRRAMQGLVTHPKYDSVVWTIPLEFYGSVVCYVWLYIFAGIPNSSLRMGVLLCFAILSMALGCWHLFCFSSGMLIADLNLAQEKHDILASSRPSRNTKIWLSVFAVSFYIAGFPTLEKAEYKAVDENPMFGFEGLRYQTPMSLPLEDHARFWWSLSGVGLLLSISQLQKLKKIFESDFCQYLGRVSFSLYLIHMILIVVFGVPLQAVFYPIAGLGPPGFGPPARTNFGYWLACALWYITFTIPIFALASWVERWVDMPSVKFAKWLEGKVLAPLINL